MSVETNTGIPYWERRELEKQQRTEWLQGLKEGDGVVVMNRSLPYCITTVERTTAKQIILAGRVERYRRDTGQQVGNTYGGSIGQVTAEARAVIRAAKNRTEFANLTHRKDSLSDAEVAVMLDALKQYREGQEGDNGHG